MKRIFALILSLTMLLGVFAYAEDSKDDLFDLLLDSEVEFKRFNLTPDLIDALDIALEKAYVEYTNMTPEQIEEWKAARKAINDTALATPIGEGDALRDFINETIDNMEGFKLLAKSNFKSSILEDLVRGYELNDDELAVYVYILTEIYEEMEAAESEEELEAFYELISDAIDGMTMGIHDARGNLMTLFSTATEPYFDALTERLASDPELAREVAVAYLAIYDRLVSVETDDSVSLENILKGLIIEIHGLGYDTENLTEAQIAEYEAIIAEAIEANFPELTDAQAAKLQGMIYKAGMDDSGTAGGMLTVLKSFNDGIGEVLNGLDEELKADIANHNEKLKAALNENNDEVIFDEFTTIAQHIFEARKGQLYETVYKLTPEKAGVIAAKVLFDAWAWEEDFDQAMSLVEFVENVEWDTLTEEEQYDVVALIVEEAIMRFELTEEIDEEYEALIVGYLVEAMTIIDSFTVEELAALDLYCNIISAYLNIGTEDDMLILKPIMEGLTHVFNFEEMGIEDVAAVAVSLFGYYDPEERLAQFDNVSDTTLMLIVREAMETYEAFMMMPEGVGAIFAETNAKIKDIASGLGIKGSETDPAVFEQLEDQIYEIFGSFAALTPLERAASSARIVARIMNYSILDPEEVALISDVNAKLNEVLANGTEEELDALKALYHSMLHLMEEGPDFE